jgi:hypothetical protein
MSIEWCQNCGQLFDAKPGDFYCSPDCRAYGHAVLKQKATPPRPQGRRKPATFSVSAGWAEVAALDAANFAPASTARPRPSGRSWR